MVFLLQTEKTKPWRPEGDCQAANGEADFVHPDSLSAEPAVTLQQKTKSKAMGERS